MTSDSRRVLLVDHGGTFEKIASGSMKTIQMSSKLCGLFWTN